VCDDGDGGVGMGLFMYTSRITFIKDDIVSVEAAYYVL
jgi:hypothetical protein